MATVIVRIPGSDDVTIVRQVVDPSHIALTIPASIGLSPVVDIVEELPTKSEDVDVEQPIDNMKDLTKKFEPTEVFDTIDTLEIADSSVVMLCNLSKLASWIESDVPLPPSAPRDQFRWSKDRKKKLKKQFDMDDECKCQKPACGTQEIGCGQPRPRPRP